ncbi:hypothetical protein ABPG74_006679 [Tetrahymena malaccensis]
MSNQMDQTANNNNKKQINNQEEMYLSFGEMEIYIEYQQQNNESENQFSYLDYVKFVFKSIIEIIILTIFVWPFILLYLPIKLISNDRASCSNLMLWFWIFLSLNSINYTVINFCFVRENMLFAVKQILKDTIFFIITAIIVTIYLKVNSNSEKQPTSEFFDFANSRLINTLLYNFGFAKQDGYFLDYQSNEFNIKDLPAPSKQFTLFESIKPIEIKELLLEFEKDLTINPFMFGLLSSVIILKLSMVFYYLYVHSQMEISNKDIIDLTVSIFTYLYITFILCRTLGNFDLIRKIDTLKQLNNYINFGEEDLFKDEKYQKKLDILSANGLECWDCSRKLLLTHEYEDLITLELAYIGLAFYYLFVILICLSSFYELYWIIPKESPLLSDTIVIMSLFNFVFLSLFFMFRFQKGTKFNDQFDELKITIQELLDVFSDLDTQYNDYFLQKQEQENQVKKNSIYGLLIIKIKQMSYKYINNKRPYLGKYYTIQQKQDLRIKIIDNIKKCLVKIQQSIQIDQQKYSYKFLNLFDIKFNEFLTTVLVVSVTSLPQIIPKFIAFYKK